jgi:hypothetical protein
MSFPSGFPMHLSGHQPQQQLATYGRSNLRCGHESHSQTSAFAKRSGQIAVFRSGLPSLASVHRDRGEVRCIHSNFPRRPLKLTWAMKQIQLSQLDPARLFTYVLSRLVEPHGAKGGDRSKERVSSGEAAAVRGGASSTSSSASLEEILKTTQRRWPSRYY